VEAVEDVGVQVLDVLVAQLGHKPTEARRMIAGAIERRPDITTFEALIEEVYRGEEGGR
jgi:Holliday junction DNA helicase RuvA